MKLYSLKNKNLQFSQNNTTNIRIPKLNLDESQLIPDELIEIVPNRLNKIVELFPNQYEKSIALLSSLPLIASVLRKTRIKGDGEITPDLYVSISGPPGSGKSAANKMRQIVSSTQKYISFSIFWKSE